MPVTFTACSIACLCANRPGNEGNNDGCTFIIRIQYRLTKKGVSILLYPIKQINPVFGTTIFSCNILIIFSSYSNLFELFIELEITCIAIPSFSDVVLRLTGGGTVDIIILGLTFFMNPLSIDNKTDSKTKSAAPDVSMHKFINISIIKKLVIKIINYICNTY